MTDIQELTKQARANGVAEHHSEQYFNRYKENEYRFEIAPNGKVVGYVTVYPNTCPSDGEDIFFVDGKEVEQDKYAACFQN